jgi:hypothetical protein
MTTASDAIVRAYLEAVQAASRTLAADEPWRRVAALLATDVRWRFAGGAGRRLWPVELNGRDAVLEQLPQAHGVLVATADRDDLGAQMRTGGTRGAGQHPRS